jgi:uncharacterized protein (DUF488 family)
MNSEHPPRPFYSVGHSTRSFEEFAGLLRENGIVTLADIRRFPGSRRHPHFAGPALAKLLAGAGVAYMHLEALGGHRKSSPASENSAWRNDSFRGYADHMATEEFRRGVDELFRAPGPVAFMCAEAVPWRCHRNLLSDELLRRGSSVIHIFGRDTTRPHQMNPAAIDRGGHLIYREPSLLF